MGLTKQKYLSCLTYAKRNFPNRSKGSYTFGKAVDAASPIRKTSNSMLTASTTEYQPLTEEDLDPTQIIFRFKAFQRDTSSTCYPRESSLEFLVMVLHVISSLVYMTLWQNKLVRELNAEFKGFDPELMACRQKRYMPTKKKWEAFVEAPVKLEATMAINWISKHIKQQTPEATSSRESVRQVLKAIEDLGLITKEEAKFAHECGTAGLKKTPSSTFTDIDIPRLLLLYREIEALYWRKLADVELSEGEGIKLPRHMFRFIKEAWQWYFGLRFSSRSELDGELLLYKEEGTSEGILIALRDEISKAYSNIRILTAELNQSRFLNLSEAEEVECDRSIKEKESLILRLNWQMSYFLPNSCA